MSSVVLGLLYLGYLMSGVSAQLGSSTVNGMYSALYKLELWMLWYKWRLGFYI